MDDGSDELPFEEEEMEQTLRALYQPGFYSQGEELCLDIIEDHAPDWEPAKLFLLLYLAAQDVEEEALDLVDELSEASLFEALRLLAFGEATEAESVVYEDIVLCAQERGLGKDMEAYFDNRDLPLKRYEKTEMPKSWMAGRAELRSTNETASSDEEESRRRKIVSSMMSRPRPD